MLLRLLERTVRLADLFQDVLDVVLEGLFEGAELFFQGFLAALGFRRLLFRLVVFPALGFQLFRALGEVFFGPAETAADAVLFKLRWL